MALLDRVKERTETDLADPELLNMIDAIQDEITRRYGPDRDVGNPISVEVEGGTARLNLNRPMDEAEGATITEYVDWPWGESVTILADDDWRAWHNGRSLERLPTGTNSRSRWGNRVDVTYVPVDDLSKREEVVIEIIKLQLQYEGTQSHQVGDTRITHSDYVKEHDRLLRKLDPRGGLLLA